MNVDFEISGTRINARVAAIIYNKDMSKVLLFKVEDGRDFYMLPGGRIEVNESSSNAIRREIKEELNFELNYQLCAIEENFMKKEDKNYMQYCFIYKAVYDEDIVNEILFCLDNDNQKFYWVDINRLDDYKVYPKSVINLISQHETEIKHFCNNIILD